MPENHAPSISLTATEGDAAEYRILGLLQVVLDGRAIELRAAKVRTLLGMLLISPNRVVAADRLAEGLWGDDPPATAVNTLQGYMSQLRKALGGSQIQTCSPGYVLAVDEDRIDAVQFERLLEEGHRARASGDPRCSVTVLAQALELWRGEALADFTYAEWAQAEIARLRELHLVATEEWIEGRLELGHHSELLSELEGLVVAHPLRERLWAARILALYRAGRQAEALRAYQELRQRLGEELGIEPSPALRSLEEDVILQRPRLEWRPPAEEAPGDEVSHNLPAPRSRLIGRERELAELEQLIATSRLVTVVGPGGVGKTRLGVELARRLRSKHPHGVWLAELASLSDPGLVAHTVASAMGVREQPGQLITESLTRALRDRRVLIVLDNCEHVIHETAVLVDELLSSSTVLSLVCTSREPLHVEGERIWVTPSLEVPADDREIPETVARFDSVRLFVERATAQGSFVLTPENARSVVQLCRRLDGLPLAIELAAARARSVAPAQMVERLGDRFRLLTSGSRTALPRHQTLRAAVDWSYELLAEPERILLRRLSVFAGGFDLEAAETVCAGQGVEGHDVVALVARLVNRSLVQTGERGGGIRYGLHETLRAYAEERLTESGEDHAVRDRHLEWAVAFAESHQAALDPGRVTDKRTVEQLTVEHDNLRHALRWALSADPLTGLRLTSAIAPFWRIGGYFEEGSQCAEVILSASPDAPLALRAPVVRWAGTLAFRGGNVHRGEHLLEEAVDIFRRLGDERNTAVTLAQLAWPAVDHRGDYETAERVLRESTAIHEGQGDDHLFSEGMAQLALLRMRRGDQEAAERLMHDALAYNLAHPDDPCPLLLAMAGHVALLRGERVQARQLLGQAIVHNREVGQRTYLAGDLGWLGELALLEGDEEEAERCLSEQLTIARDDGSWRSIRHSLRGLAKLAIRRGDLAYARSALREGIRMTTQRAGAPVAEDLESAAVLLSAEGRSDQAARMLGTAQALRDGYGTPLPPAYQAERDRLVFEIEAQGGTEAFVSAFRQGRSLTPYEVLAEAGLVTVDSGQAPSRPSIHPRDALAASASTHSGDWSSCEGSPKGGGIIDPARRRRGLE